MVVVGDGADGEPENILATLPPDRVIVGAARISTGKYNGVSLPD
jgi:hypothetical protein